MIEPEIGPFDTPYVNFHIKWSHKIPDMWDAWEVDHCMNVDPMVFEMYQQFMELGGYVKKYEWATWCTRHRFISNKRIKYSNIRTIKIN